jgi:predicted metal-dependent hydrolase
MTLRPETALALERGRALYNAARYYEAHEAWEDAWLGEQGEARLLLQGLIQVAAGYFKALAHRRPGGAARLLAGGLEKLGRLPEGLGGLSLAPFRDQVARSLAEVQRWKDGEVAALDPGLAPRLERAG